VRKRISIRISDLIAAALKIVSMGKFDLPCRSETEKGHERGVSKKLRVKKVTSQKAGAPHQEFGHSR